MKKILAVLALLATVTTLTFAQGQGGEKKAEKVNGPAIQFEATTIDYGVIEQGADPYRIFKFKNTGTEPLIISNATGSCGCTVPDWPKEAIAPGASGEIKVRYDTNRIGGINKSVTVTTNTAEGSVMLYIKGEVKKKETGPSGLPTKEGNPFNKSN